MSHHDHKHFGWTPTPSEVERLIYYMPSVAIHAENTWAKGFAQSVVKQSRRKNWTPSLKQLSVMRGLVSDLFAYARDDVEEFNPIES
jgi:hypothetical protein